MKTIELQNTIIKKILATKDNQLLDHLNILLSKGLTEDVYSLNDFELSVINESLEEYYKGKIISNDEVFAKTKKWLEE